MPRSFSRMLAANRTLIIAYPEAFADPEAPTADELNATNNMVFNVSCAMLSDTALNLSDSDTDDDRTWCSVGNSVFPTYENADLNLTGLRDASLTVNNCANALFWLTKVPDIPLILIDRIGYPPATPFAVGQRIDIFSVTTDNPTRAIPDRGNITHTNVPKLASAPVTNYEIAA